MTPCTTCACSLVAHMKTKQREGKPLEISVWCSSLRLTPSGAVDKAPLLVLASNNIPVSVFTQEDWQVVSTSICGPNTLSYDAEMRQWDQHWGNLVQETLSAIGVSKENYAWNEDVSDGTESSNVIGSSAEVSKELNKAGIFPPPSSIRSQQNRRQFDLSAYTYEKDSISIIDRIPVVSELGNVFSQVTKQIKSKLSNPPANTNNVWESVSYKEICSSQLEVDRYVETLVQNDSQVNISYESKNKSIYRDSDVTDPGVFETYSQYPTKDSDRLYDGVKSSNKKIPEFSTTERDSFPRTALRQRRGISDEDSLDRTLNSVADSSNTYGKIPTELGRTNSFQSNQKSQLQSNNQQRTSLDKQKSTDHLSSQQTVVEDLERQNMKRVPLKHTRDFGFVHLDDDDDVEIAGVLQFHLEQTGRKSPMYDRINSVASGRHNKTSKESEINKGDSSRISLKDIPSTHLEDTIPKQPNILLLDPFFDELIPKRENNVGQNNLEQKLDKTQTRSDISEKNFIHTQVDGSSEDYATKELCHESNIQVEVLTEEGVSVNQPKTRAAEYSVSEKSLPGDTREGSRRHYHDHLEADIWTLEENDESLHKKLLDAVLQHNVEEAERLIKLGADVNTTSPDIFGDTLLHLATSDGDVQMIKLLLKSGARTYISNAFTHTPLYNAVIERRYEIAKVLLENGADPNAKDATDNTLMDIALRLGDNKIINLLLKYRARITKI